MIEVKEKQGVFVVSFPSIKRVNAQISQQLKDNVSDLLNEEGVCVIIDFSGVIFVDSAGFGSLISVFKLAKDKDCVLLISSLSKEVFDLFEIMQLDKIFKIFPSLDQALSSCK